MGITAATRIVAVIGHPVTHSLSPAIHNAAFDELGVDCRMVAFEVAPGKGKAAIAAMSTLGIAGFAVTTPLKAEVAAAVDVVDEASRSLDSANTVVLRDDGSRFGASTDGTGFVASLLAAGRELDGARVVVLGAGAASRSIVHALGETAAERITIVNRTAATADVAAALAPQAEVGTVDAVQEADLLVNTTTVGMGDPDASPIGDTDLLHSSLTVADIVYHPLDTRLLRDARAAGATTIDGLGMLVEQARLQQQLWIGDAGDASTMRAAAQAELARR